MLSKYLKKKRIVQKNVGNKNFLFLREKATLQKFASHSQCEVKNFFSNQSFNFKLKKNSNKTYIFLMESPNLQ